MHQSTRPAAVKTRLLVALGGDNSATYPVMAGAFDVGLERCGLVTLAPHHDYPRGPSNGTPVRQLVEAGLPAERIVQVGIADWANSKSYADEVAAVGINVVSRGEVADRGITTCMTEALEIAAAG